jgi:hypothetical protein
MEKKRNIKILSLCLSMVVWFLGFNLRKEVKGEKKNDNKN